MSTSFLQIDNRTVLDGSSERLVKLQRLLNELAKSVGFLGAIYIVDFNDNVIVKDSHLAISLNKKSSGKRKNFLYSNPPMKSLRTEFSKKAIEVEPNLHKMNTKSYAIFSYEGDTPAERLCRQVLKPFGIRSRLYYRAHSDNFPDFEGVFFLMTERSPDELQAFAEENWEDLRATLQKFHEIAIASSAIPEISPLTGLGLVSNKGKEILEMISDGYSRTEISQKLFLTERGVDYHISKLKVLFNAKNNAHLVKAAYRYKMLS